MNLHKFQLSDFHLKLLVLSPTPVSVSEAFLLRGNTAARGSKVTRSACRCVRVKTQKECGTGGGQRVILTKALILPAIASISQTGLFLCCCMMFAQSSPFTEGFFLYFPVFLQSLRAFSRSTGEMLNNKEHPSALFQDVVCSSNTIKCLYKGPGARNKHIFIKI